MPLVDSPDDLLRLAAASPHPHTRVERATLIYDDERNAARTVHGIGFRPVCGECGALGLTASYHMARGALREHVRNVHRADQREAASPTREKGSS